MSDCTCAGTAPGWPQHEDFCGIPERDDDCTCGYQALDPDCLEHGWCVPLADGLVRSE